MNIVNSVVRKFGINSIGEKLPVISVKVFSQLTLGFFQIEFDWGQCEECHQIKRKQVLILGIKMDSPKFWNLDSEKIDLGNKPKKPMKKSEELFFTQ